MQPSPPQLQDENAPGRILAGPSFPAPAPPTAAAPLYQGYQPNPGFLDEMLQEGGRPRPHWQRWMSYLADMGAAEMGLRWEQARRLIHENGVTYNVYGDPRGMERPWQLDPLPVLVSAADWQTIEGGVAQRARLLDLVMADLYGPQTLLRDNLLPPALLFAHPGFLRPCHGVAVPQRRYLHMVASDVGRGPDGKFWILGDRTQAPSGMGYALENRIVLSRTFAEAFRDCQVQRLALFFRTLRQTVAALAPQHADNPRIVVLTPGPLNETYFEHAYLARYLGYTLVEGADLTVRDDQVYLKTLGGLHQVDVIVRRLDDDFCDPLELRANSTLGVPGLMQAVRAGNVAVVNALGSGLVESPALLPYLPALCKALLGEELAIPSVNTWWCGDPPQLNYVLAHLRQLVIKPAFPTRAMEPVFGETLAEPEFQNLADRLRARPLDFVAQERVSLSTTPVLAQNHLEPRHMMMRVCLTAAGDGYAVMPGGLTRIGASADSLVVSMQRGGGSKDTWVLSDEPVSNFTLLAGPGESLELSRGGGDLPSRVADNLFWLGRYVERTHGLIRLFRVVLARWSEQIGAETSPEFLALLQTVAHMTSTAPAALVREGKAAPQTMAELSDMLTLDTRPGGIRAAVAAVRRVAGLVRDRISSDTWRVIFTLDQDFDQTRTPTRLGLGEAMALLNRAILPLSAFNGLVTESMTRGQGWIFLDLGCRLERALQTAQLLRTTLVRPLPQEAPLLEAVLEVTDSIMTYRRRYLATLQAGALLDLLLTDESNPRSVAFQMARLSDHLAQLPGEHAMPARATEERITISLLSTLRLTQVERLCLLGPGGERNELDDLLDRLYIELPALSDALSSSYLSHTRLTQQLGAGGEAPPPEAAGNSL